MSAHSLAAGHSVSDHAPIAGVAANAPVILLTCSHSGAEALSDLLSVFPSLACTSRTGLLPTCEAVAATWRRIEGRANPSSLALSSIRALATSMICLLTAESGAERWCEVAISRPGTAEGFLKVFPGAKFICFYRRCEDVISEAIASHPWGFGGSEFWQFSSVDQGNSVAMVAAYWADCTRALLDFERAQSQSCLAVRREDLEADPDAQLEAICAFLGLSTMPSNKPQLHDRYEVKPTGNESCRFPLDRLPLHLLTAVNTLQARLDYSPLAGR